MYYKYITIPLFRIKLLFRLQYLIEYAKWMMNDEYTKIS